MAGFWTPRIVEEVVLMICVFLDKTPRAGRDRERGVDIAWA